jgi:hypothetical protein
VTEEARVTFEEKKTRKKKGKKEKEKEA